MSSKKENGDRLGQKLRTRAALLAAARELVARGQTPTIPEVADAAMVSRATAYRYFTRQEELLAEVPLDQAAPTVASLFGEHAPADPEDRVALVQNALYDLSRDHETEFRLFLRTSIARALRDTDGSGDPFRGGRRIALLTEALAPLASELPAEDIERLKMALAMLVGTEPMIVMRDVMRVEHEQARAIGEWAVRQLVRAARAGQTSSG